MNEGEPGKTRTAFPVISCYLLYVVSEIFRRFFFDVQSLLSGCRDREGLEGMVDKISSLARYEDEYRSTEFYPEI